MHESPRTPGSWFRSTSGLVLLAFLGIIGFFLITEHAAHLFGALPYLLLLAWPLMHFFHRGHGGGHGAGDGDHGGAPPPTGRTPR